MVIPYIPAVAGMLVYADFSSLLPQKTFEWEEILSTILFHHARVVLTPGASQRNVEPGIFRIYYARVSPNVLDIAMERLSRIVARLQSNFADDWKLAAQTPNVLSEKPTDDQDLSPVTPPHTGGMSHSHSLSSSPQAAIHGAFAGVLDC